MQGRSEEGRSYIHTKGTEGRLETYTEKKIAKRDKTAIQENENYAADVWKE